MSNVAYLSQQDKVDIQVSSSNPEVVVYLYESDTVSLDLMQTVPALSLVLSNVLIVTPSGPATYVYINMVASQNISIHTVVAPDGTGGVVYATNNNPSQVGKPMGIAWNSATSGNQVQVITTGEVDESTWNWNPGEVYLGINGGLTQTPPTSGILQVIGVALTATRLSVGIQLPIILN
jgi:hypothetical protein